MQVSQTILVLLGGLIVAGACSAQSAVRVVHPGTEAGAEASAGSGGSMGAGGQAGAREGGLDVVSEAQVSEAGWDAAGEAKAADGGAGVQIMYPFDEPRPVTTGVNQIINARCKNPHRSPHLTHEV